MYTHERGLRQSVDWKLVISYIALVIIGWVNIYASIHSAESASIFDISYRSGKQFLWIISGAVIAGLILFVLNPNIWESFSLPLYVIAITLLIAVIFFGIEVKGSRSWFAFGPIRFQPAEISKITTSLLLATIMSQINYKIGKTRDFLITAFVIILPMFIILCEKETGSALLYCGFLFTLYREGLSGWFLFIIGVSILLLILTLTVSAYTSVLVLIFLVTLCTALYNNKIKYWFLTYATTITAIAFLPWLWRTITELIITDEASGWTFLLKINPLYILIGISLAILPHYGIRAYREKNIFLGRALLAFLGGIIIIFSTDFLFNNVLQEHQRKRIEVLLGLKEDPAGVGYNVNQSMIAIGSGGLTGKGYLNGTQTTYGFVPEQSTDFIFCTIGEEWGFIGCAAVIGIYVFMIIRILLDAEKSRSSFTRIYGYCVASCIFMHLFINIGMTIGLMPVIGIPLPFLSYGGSSLWAFTILLFIFIALDKYEKKYF